MITTYLEAVKYLEDFIGKIVFNVKDSKDPLLRMRLFLEKLGNPQNKFSSVLIGGTSGKGSTATILSQILHTSGYTTGLTISPHLQSVIERIQLNCVSISEKEFVLLLNTVVPAIEQMEKETTSAPSYFEILVAMAFVYFAEKKVDIAVVEVGMGGEFDATNTLSPLVAVFTNVSLDHTKILGNTVEEIARTKAGIVKKLSNNIVRPANWRRELLDARYRTFSKNKLHNANEKAQLRVVSGVRQASVIEIVKNRCEEAGASLSLLGKEFKTYTKSVTEKGSKFDFLSGKIIFTDLFLSLPGEFQIENAALAIKAALQLEHFGFIISEENIRKALRTVLFAGRFELIQFQSRYSGSPPVIPDLIGDLSKWIPAFAGMTYVARMTKKRVRMTVLLDGAHNSAKMKAFLESVNEIFPKKKKIFVIAFKNDKDIKKLLKQILKEADVLILTEYGGKTDIGLHTSYSVEKLFEEVKEIQKDAAVFAEKNSKKAMEKAFVLAKKFPDSLIIVTGSLYLVGEVREDLVSNVDLT